MGEFLEMEGVAWGFEDRHSDDREARAMMVEVGHDGGGNDCTSSSLSPMWL